MFCQLNSKRRTYFLQVKFLNFENIVTSYISVKSIASFIAIEWVTVLLYFRSGIMHAYFLTKIRKMCIICLINYVNTRKNHKKKILKFTGEIHVQTFLRVFRQFFTIYDLRHAQIKQNTNLENNMQVDMEMQAIYVISKRIEHQKKHNITRKNIICLNNRFVW